MKIKSCLTGFLTLVICELLKLHAQQVAFTTLHAFAAFPLNYVSPETNADGASPQSSLILSGSTLYGTTFAGGTSGEGTLFAINTDGSAFTNSHTFSALSGATNGDGVRPIAGLTLLGNTLYGTATYGGTNGGGTVFQINTDGTGFTIIHNFNNQTFGAYDPDTSLILSGNILYGAANGGGNGTIFEVNTNGSYF
jgi:uncharacterized repeat protein (TIGR03803 family)